jgi:hypothetical protein
MAFPPVVHGFEYGDKLLDDRRIREPRERAELALWVHGAVRSHGIRAIIPATRGRPSDEPPAGRWRRRMKQRFGQYKRKYGQRWQVETVNSMIKRRLGSALRARVEANQFREIILRAITHNVMIARLQVFYRAAG